MAILLTGSPGYMHRQSPESHLLGGGGQRTGLGVWYQQPCPVPCWLRSRCWWPESEPVMEHSQPATGSWDKRVTPTIHPTAGRQGSEGSRGKRVPGLECMALSRAIGIFSILRSLGSVPQLTKGMLTWLFFFYFCWGSWWLVPPCDMQDLPQPGMEPVPPALKAWSLNNWATREILTVLLNDAGSFFTWILRPIHSHLFITNEWRSASQ